jgi:putative oxidoreductase
MAYQSMDRPRYVVPALGTVYSAIEVYSWPLVRAATGFFFLPHGMQKLFGFWGGICLILGLLTRPVAALFAGFMFVAAFHVHMQIGWFWTNRGMEVPFYLLLICLSIMIRGGGPLSLDSRLGREI